MNIDLIGEITLCVFEILETQEGCESICDGIDRAETNEELKYYLEIGIEKMREFSENDLADDLVEKLKIAF
jgi:hypothetical protein